MIFRFEIGLFCPVYGHLARSRSLLLGLPRFDLEHCTGECSIWNTVFAPIGHGLGFIRRKWHHSNRNFTLNSKMKVPGPHSLILISFLMIFMLEHCFCTNWARFRFYPTKIPPFEPQFHAEFENEGPRASFFDFDIVFNDCYVGTLFLHQFGTV